MQQENNQVQIKGHSQGPLLGISLIRFRKKTLERLLNIGNKQAGDPRQQPSGMKIKKHVILNLIQDLPRLLCLLRNSMRGRFQIKFGMTPLFNKRGFTLIELLVVVLIIGILAAIAVPQYQKAVLKSRYLQAVTLTEKMNSAQQLYYLEHGQYANTFDELNTVMDMPAKTSSGGSSYYFYKWGYCWIHDTPYVACGVYNAGVAHVIFLKTLSRQCWVNGTSNNAHALCQDVTKEQTGNVSGTWTQYSY